MTTAEDVLVRWGLHELEGSGYAADDAGSSGTRTMNISSQERSEAGRAPSTASDALIARALQEEFHRLAAAEAAGVAGPAAHVEDQTWIDKAGSPVVDSSSEDESSDESERVGGGSKSSAEGDSHGHVIIHDWAIPDKDTEGRQRGSASSSTSFQDPSPYGLDDDDRQLAFALSEEYPQVDKEVARRLTKLESIKHVPRTNRSIPTYEDASADHQRLRDRLEMYGLTEQKIKGDGNCQFRALSDQLYRTPRNHKYVRKSVLKQLKTNSEVYADYVPMNYTDYVKNLAKNGEWGDHVTLQAASDYYGVKIRLITSFKDTCFIEIEPTEEKSKREIYLSFWAEVHYNSIYPVGELYPPPSAHHGKKRDWLKKLF